MTLLVPTFVPFTFHWYEGVVPPLIGAAVNATEVPLQTGFEDAVIETDAACTRLTVIETELEVAGEPLTQAAFDVITHVTTSPLAGMYEYNVLLVPTLDPLTFHWYDGVVPPLAGVAVNVTEVPAQTGFTEAVTETEAVTNGLTDMLTWFEVAGEPLTHDAFDVITHVTASPFAGVYEYVALLAPTFALFTFHWYAGVMPPLAGVAVNVTGVPAQILFTEAAIETEAVTLGFTVMTAVPFILLWQAVEDALIALTEYVPAAVCSPNVIAEPVPETGVPVLEPLSRSW